MMSLSPKTKAKAKQVVDRTRDRVAAARSRAGVELHVDLDTVELLLVLAGSALGDRQSLADKIKSGEVDISLRLPVEAVG